MKKLLFCALSVLLALAFCKNAPDASANSGTKFTGQIKDLKTLEGNWISRSFINRCATTGSVVQTLKNPRAMPYAFAFTFIASKPDSVWCYDHTRRWSAPVRINVDTIELVGVANGKSLYMEYQSNPEKSLTLYDRSSGDLVIHYFVQTREKTVNGYQAFATALNHNVLGGGFRLVGSKDPNAVVAFSPVGLVSGLSEFKVYQVCAGGNCLVTGDKMDAIMLANPKTQKGGWYGFQFNGGLDTMTIYNLKSETPNETGTYYPTGVAFKLARLPKQEPSNNQ